MKRRLPLGRMRSSKVALNVPAGSMAPVSASLLAPFLMTPRTLLTVLIMAPSNLATSRWELNMPWNHTARHSSVWATSRWELNMPWNHAERCPAKSTTISQEMSKPWNCKEVPFKINHQLGDEHALKLYRDVLQNQSSARRWTCPEIVQRDTFQNQPLPARWTCPEIIQGDTLQNQPPSARRWTCPEIMKADALQNQPPSARRWTRPEIKDRHSDLVTFSWELNTDWNHTERQSDICQL